MINILKTALIAGRKIVESVQGLAAESTIAHKPGASDSRDS